jgi:arsenate reductase (glutaredoxin)
VLRSSRAVSKGGLLRMSVTIYHNPACGTSRNTLALIRATGSEPKVVHYLDTPPTREELVKLIERMGIAPRDLLRRKGTPFAELGLDDPALTEDQLIDAMMAHPILMNRSIDFGPQAKFLLASLSHRPVDDVVCFPNQRESMRDRG